MHDFILTENNKNTKNIIPFIWRHDLKEPTGLNTGTCISRPGPDSSTSFTSEFKMQTNNAQKVIQGNDNKNSKTIVIQGNKDITPFTRRSGEDDPAGLNTGTCISQPGPAFSKSSSLILEMQENNDNTNPKIRRVYKTETRRKYQLDGQLLPTVGNIGPETSAIQAKRRHRYQQLQDAKQKPVFVVSGRQVVANSAQSDYIPKFSDPTTEAAKKIIMQQKQNARDAYKRRKRNYTLHSPELWSSEQESAERRIEKLKKYSRKHKCIHGMWFNMYTMHEEDEYWYIVPKCRHPRNLRVNTIAPLTPQQKASVFNESVTYLRIKTDPKKCDICHQFKVNNYLIKAATCTACSVELCTYCKNNTFINHATGTRSIIHNHTRTENNTRLENEPRPTQTRTWGVIQTVKAEKIDEEEEEPTKKILPIAPKARTWKKMEPIETPKYLSDTKGNYNLIESTTITAESEHIEPPKYSLGSLLTGMARLPIREDDDCPEAPAQSGEVSSTTDFVLYEGPVERRRREVREWKEQHHIENDSMITCVYHAPMDMPWTWCDHCLEAHKYLDSLFNAKLAETADHDVLNDYSIVPSTFLWCKTCAQNAYFPAITPCASCLWYNYVHLDMAPARVQYERYTPKFPDDWGTETPGDWEAPAQDGATITLEEWMRFGEKHSPFLLRDPRAFYTYHNLPVIDIPTPARFELYYKADIQDFVREKKVYRYFTALVFHMVNLNSVDLSDLIGSAELHEAEVNNLDNHRDVWLVLWRLLYAVRGATAERKTVTSILTHGFTTTIGTLVATARDIVKRVSTSMKSFIALLKSYETALEHGLKAIKDFIFSLETLYTLLVSIYTLATDNNIIFYPLICSIIRLCRSSSIAGFLSNIAEIASLAALICGYSNIQDVVNKVISLFKGENAESEDIFTWFTSLIRNVFPGISITLLVKKLSTFNTLCSTTKNIGYLFSHLMKYLPQCVVTFFESTDKRIFLSEALGDPENPLFKLNLSAIAFQRMLAHEDTAGIAAAQIDFKTKQQEALEYLTTLGQKFVKAPELMRFLAEMDKMPEITIHPERRDEPFVLYVHGPSGVGKSTITEVLLTALFPVPDDATDEEADQHTEALRKRIYYRNPGSEYWDAFQETQDIIVYDDFNQNREEIDLMEVILCASTGDFMPPIANIDSRMKTTMGVKGVQVRPKVVICVSNILDINPTTLNCKEAINRRRNFTLMLHHNYDHREGANRAKNADFSHVAFEYRIEQQPVTRAANLREVLVTLDRAYTDFVSRKTALATSTRKLFYQRKMDPSSGRPAGYRLGVGEAPTNDAYLRYTMLCAKIAFRLTAIGTLGAAATAYVVGAKYLTGYLANRGYIVSQSRYFECPWKTTMSIAYRLAIGISTAFVTASILSRLYDILFPPPFLQSGEQNLPRSTRPVRGVGMAQSGTAIDPLMNNVVHLEHSGRSNHAVFVQGNTMLLNRHFLRPRYGRETLIPDGTHITIHTPNQDSIVTMPFERARMFPINRNRNGALEETDMILYKCPVYVHKRPTIASRFTKGDYDFKGRLITMIGTNGTVFTTNTGHCTVDRMMIKQVFHGEEIYKVQLHNIIGYDISTQAGDCGSLLVIDDDTIQEKLIGIHVVGRSGVTPPGGTILTADELKANLEVVNAAYPDLVRKPTRYEVPARMDEALAQSGLQGDILIMGRTARKFLPPRNTKIVPSPLHDKVCTHTTIPAILEPFDTPNGVIDPYKNGVNKYSEILHYMNPETLKVAAEGIIEELDPSAHSTILHTNMTLDHAINGHPRFPHIDQIDMNTSPGLPYCMEGKTKRDLFNYVDGKYHPGPRLQEEIDTYISDLENGVEPDFVYLDTLKDERRPIAKVQAGKTRVFSIAPVSWTILGRLLFLPTISHLTQIRDNTPLRVGMNKGSVEWNSLGKYLEEVGNDSVLDFDYSQFDSKADLNTSLVAREILCRLADMIGNPEFSKIRRRYLVCDAMPRHYYKNFIIAIMATSSGFMATVWINNLINKLYIRSAYLELVPSSLATNYWFRVMVRIAVYGDDLIMSIRAILRDTFNFKTIQQYFAARGIEITSAAKGDTSDFRPLDECTFLKCAFARQGDRYVPKMEYDAMVEPLNWIRKNKYENPDKLCEDNCNSVLRTAYFHGPETFERIRAAVLQHKPKYNLLEYSTLDYQYYTDGAAVNEDGTFFFTNTGIEPKIFFGDRRMPTLLPEQPYEDSNQQTVEGADSDHNMQSQFIEQHYEQPEAEAQSGDLDSSVPIMDKSVGVTLAEQSSTGVIPRIEQVATAAPRASAVNTDSPYTLNMQVERWNLVRTDEWNAGQTAGTNILLADVPFDLLQNTISSTPFINYFLWRCEKIKIRVDVSSSRFLQGRLVCGFRPTMAKGVQLKEQFPDVRNAQYLQHGRVDPASNTVLDIEIPFTHYKQYLNVVEGDSLGQFYIIVLNPLSGATGSVITTEIKTYVSIINPEFKVPRPGDTPLRLLNFRNPKPLDYDDWSSAPAQGGIIDNVDEMIGSAITELKPISLVADMLGYLLDKPQNAANPGPLVVKDVQYWSNFSNVDHVEYLGPEPSSMQLGDPEHFGASTQEMDAAYLMKNKMTYIKTVDWTTSNTPGEVLWTEFVGPNAAYQSEMPVAPVGTINVGKVPRMTDYVANMFSFWRGGFFFIFDIVSSAFHEGKLDICYQPFVDLPSATLAAANSQYVQSYKLRNADNVFKVKVPYLGDTPVKNIYVGQKYSINPPTPETFDFNDFFTGNISLRVSSTLRATTNISPSVQINIYMMAAEDLHYFHSTMQGSSMQLYAPKFIPPEAPAQSGETDGPMDFATMPYTTLSVTEGDAYDASNPHFGTDNTMNLKDMCKRYNYAGGITIKPTTNTYSIGQFSIIAGTTNIFTTRVEQMFRLIRGTMCVKIIPRNLGPNFRFRGFVTALPSWCRYTGPSSQPAYWAGGQQNTTTSDIARTYFSNTQIAEFKIPMLNTRAAPKISHLNDNYYDTANTQTWVLQIAVQVDGPIGEALPAIDFDIYTSFADETVCGVFMGLPKTYIGTFVDPVFGTTSVYPDEWVIPTPPLPTTNNKKTNNTATTAQGRRGMLSSFI